MTNDFSGERSRLVRWVEGRDGRREEGLDGGNRQLDLGVVGGVGFGERKSFVRR